MKEILDAISKVAFEPYSFIVYFLVILFWGLLAFRNNRNKNLLRHLEKFLPEDRAGEFGREIGEPLPPNLSPKEWVKYKRWKLYFYGFLAVLASLTILFILSRTVFIDGGASEAQLDGDRHLLQSQWAEAIKDSKKLIQLKPKSSAGYRILGTAYYKQHNFSAAANEFKKAAELEPNASNILNLGAAYMALRDYGSAMDQFEPLVKSDPANLDVRYNFAILNLLSGLNSTTADRKRLLSTAVENFNVVETNATQNYLKASAELGKAVAQRAQQEPDTTWLNSLRKAVCREPRLSAVLTRSTVNVEDILYVDIVEAIDKLPPSSSFDRIVNQLRRGTSIC